MNKKLLMLFMAVLLAVFTAACGSNNAAPATTAGDATKAPEKHRKLHKHPRKLRSSINWVKQN
nr:hypothetical protein [Brevibacillus brevis]